MGESGTPHLAAGQADIGGLVGRANDAGEIKKIAVVRQIATGEKQSAIMAPI